MLASELSAQCAPQDETARTELVMAISRMCDVITTAGGEVALRLKGAGACGGASAPLPISVQSVRALLLAQPAEQMDAAALRARFAPRDEAERQCLVDTITELADLVPPEDTAPCSGLLVKLRRATGVSAGSSTHPAAAHALANELPSSAIAETDAIASAERELVRKVLAAHPDGLRADDLSRMVALGGGGAKRRRR